MDGLILKPGESYLPFAGAPSVGNSLSLAEQQFRFAEIIPEITEDSPDMKKKIKTLLTKKKVEGI